jgi:hypothetical protein
MTFAAKVFLLFLAVISLCFVLHSCSRSSRVFVYTEDYWWEYLAGEEGFEEHLRSAVESRGYRLSIVKASPDDTAGAWQSLAPGGNHLVLLSPFSLANAPAMAERYPSTLFLVMRAPLTRDAADEFPPNLAILIFDRTETYRQAGRILGRLVQTHNNLSSQQPLRKSQKCGIVVWPLSEETRREVLSFREGFLQESVPEFLVEKEVLDQSDRVKIKKQIEDMRARGVTYYLLKMYTLTGYCLEILQAEGGWAVVEDWHRAGAYEELILFSVEEDYLSAVYESLNHVLRQSSRWQQERFRGPSRIVWGKHGVELKEDLKELVPEFE